MCSIFGIAGHDEAAYITYLGLHSLQHRGQEGYGIACYDNGECNVHRQRGVVKEVSLKGTSAIGHTRYSTTGQDNLANLQPLCMKSSQGWMSLAHNGNLIDSNEWTFALEQQGAIFQTSTDTEIIMHLLARCKGMDLPDAVVCAMKQVEGSYSLLVMDKDYLIAIRDPYGFRPLSYGEYKNSIVFASESCAFDMIGANSIGDVKPGEMRIVNLKTMDMKTRQVFEPKPHKCVFELIYFSKPDSEVFGQSVYKVRKALGRKLAQEQPVDVDLVVPVPDSGVAAALGYAEESGIPFEMGIIRGHYLRTFIQPKQSLRDIGVRLKLNAIKSVVRGKRIAIVDDSLVRGTTSKKIIQMLREAGASEVHLRVSAPPTIGPCYYGIDTPDKHELIASKMSVEDIRSYIQADSLGYISLDGLKEVVGDGFCHACFSNEYPTLIPLQYRHK